MNNGGTSSGAPGVLIVGAGFGGLAVARALERAPVKVTVLDRRNYTLFQPLLYQVATAALAPSDVAVPIRSLLRAPNTEVLLDEVVGVDRARSHVQTASGLELPFRFLVLASGSEPNYFGHHDWADLAPSPKGLADAVAIRERVLAAFEQAETVRDQADRRSLMTLVVAGGGATGVEMAGALAELTKRTLERDFRRIRPARARILLVEGGPTLLAGFPDRLRAYTERKLLRLGVEVRLNTRIEQIDGHGVLAGAERIPARVVIWCAGVKATPVASWLGAKPSHHGSVRVRNDFSLEGSPNVFVVGDAAEVFAGGKTLPKLAATAKQQGQYLGALIKHRVESKETRVGFRYRDYGRMATIGRAAAVADLRGFRLKGAFAWVLWGIVHIYFLIGFRNRLLVLVNWFWAWLTHSGGARLILSEQAIPSITTSRAAPLRKEPTHE